MPLVRVAEPHEIGQAAALAPLAYEEFAASMTPAAHGDLKAAIARTTGLADGGILLLATEDASILGSVVYCAPGVVEHPLFTAEQAYMRAMSVQPEARGRGAGRALAETCLARARTDGARVFALHTADVMRSARKLYAALGFEETSDGPRYFGLRYRVYGLDL